MSKWEQSGNGSGMRVETDNEFGHIANDQSWGGQGLEEVFDGDNRNFFLRTEKSHVLCYWQVFDDDHLLSHSLCKLSDSVRVDSANVPLTNMATPGSAGKDDDKKFDRDFKEKVSSSFSQLACDNSLNQCRVEKKNFRELRCECKDCSDEEEKIMLKKDMEDSEKILNALKNNLGF